MWYGFTGFINTIIALKFVEDLCMDKFIITPKEDKTVTMTIRIDRTLQEEYNLLAEKTNRSRNELIGMALRYALDNMELVDE